MIRQEINTGWQLRGADGFWQEAQVPGTVYTDLLRNGKMEDPFWKDNEDAACALMNEDYEYEAVFAVSRELLACRRVVLRFDGLDTVAEISVNGTRVGSACSMHRVWEYEVKELLHPGENRVLVHFSSPLKWIAEAYKKYGNIGNDDTYEGFMHLRKAHYMFGWDWGAHLPDAGIYRPVWLLGIDGDRIDSVYLARDIKNRVTLLLEAKAEAGSGRFLAEVTAPDGEVLTAQLDSEKEDLVVEHSGKLWWPNGLGEQPLYQVQVSLLDESGKVWDIWERSRPSHDDHEPEKG